MSIMNYRIFLFILPLVFAAGCTVPDIFPGQDVIRAAPTTQEEGFRDVLVIKEITTIPKSPVLAGRTVLLSFIIENRDKEKEAKDAIVDLFDAPLFKDKDGRELCNKAKCNPIGNECSESKKCAILPGEQKQITFELKAPDDQAVAGLQTDIDINFRVTYRFSGSTLLKLIVVNLDEIKARQRAGSSITLDILKSLGSGPIKIDAELKGAPYILSDHGGTLAFTVKSAGDTSKGGITDSKILKFGLASLGLRIKFPEELVTSTDNLLPPSAFICGFSKERTIDCFNKDDITLFKGESPPLLFQINRTPTITVPFKSFDVKALLNYIYELRDSTKVTVLPLAKIR